MNDFENPMLLSAEALEYLRRARRWSGLLSTLALGLLGLMLLLALFIVVNTIFSGALSILQVLPILLIGIIYFFPLWYLYKFSHHSKLALSQQDETELTRAFRFLWLHYRFLGILLICIFVFYVIVISMGILPLSDLAVTE